MKNLRNEQFVPPHSWYTTNDQVEIILLPSLRYELVSHKNQKIVDIGRAKVVQIRPKVRKSFSFKKSLYRNSFF